MKRGGVRRLRGLFRKRVTRAASGLRPGPLRVPAWSRLTIAASSRKVARLFGQDEASETRPSLDWKARPGVVKSPQIACAIASLHERMWRAERRRALSPKRVPLKVSVFRRAIPLVA